MPIRSRMSSIMGQIDENIRSYLPLNLKKIAEIDFVYSLPSTNMNQSAPNLVKLYVIIKSLMSSIMDLIGPKLSKLSAFELVKFAIFDVVYTLASENIDHSVPNLATIYMPIRIGSVRLWVKFD